VPDLPPLADLREAVARDSRALLAVSGLRVDVGGSPAIDGLTLSTTGDRVLVLGAARALFEAAAGLRAPSRGEIRVEGVSPRAAVSGGVAAGAPLDPPMPPAWTVLQYVTWSARLAGHPKATARGMAAEALERMHLGRVAGTRLGGVAPATRRGTVLAAAIATGARTLLVEDPLPGLPSEAERPFARVIARALSEHRVALFAGRVPLESPLALASDEALVIDGAVVSAQGAPGELAASERTVALRVHGDVAAFARAVEAGGGRAEVTVGAPPPVHVRVELGPLAARDLLRMAAECEAVVVELRPLARAFA
jgi:ABC-2 type transport system ATP-binding protein